MGASHSHHFASRNSKFKWYMSAFLLAIFSRSRYISTLWEPLERTFLRDDKAFQWPISSEKLLIIYNMAMQVPQLLILGVFLERNILLAHNTVGYRVALLSTLDYHAGSARYTNKCSHKSRLPAPRRVISEGQFWSVSSLWETNAMVLESLYVECHLALPKLCFMLSANCAIGRSLGSFEPLELG